MTKLRETCFRYGVVSAFSVGYQKKFHDASFCADENTCRDFERETTDKAAVSILKSIERFFKILFKEYFYENYSRRYGWR